MVVVVMLFKRVWADLVEPVGARQGKAVGGDGGGEERGLSAGAGSWRAAERRERCRRRYVGGASRWPAVRDWSRAAAVVGQVVFGLTTTLLLRT